MLQYGEGKAGITARTEVGFLVWPPRPGCPHGSRLKTPILPIWVTCIDSHWGILFNPNKGKNVVQWVYSSLQTLLLIISTFLRTSKVNLQREWPLSQGF